MATTQVLDKKKWLGYRWHQHGLDGTAGQETLNSLLFLGIQDSRQSGQVVSLAQRRVRINGTDPADAITPEGPLVNMWSVRGAPHAHSVSHLDLIKQAHAPQPSDEGGAARVADINLVASALSDVVTQPMTKADVSAEVAKIVPNRLVAACPQCRARHIPDAIFRAGGTQAQLVLGPPQQRATTLCPKPRHRQEPSANARQKLLQALFWINGPATRRQLQDWLLASSQTVDSLLATAEDEIVPVTVDRHRCEVPRTLLDEINAADSPSGIVFLPPNDPYLRQVDRTLLIPDKSRRQELFKSLSGPGALLVDGEVVGTWRYRHKDGITVQGWSKMSASIRARAEESGQLLCRTLGGREATITWHD